MEPRSKVAHSCDLLASLLRMWYRRDVHPTGFLDLGFQDSRITTLALAQPTSAVLARLVGFGMVNPECGGWLGVHLWLK